MNTGKIALVIVGLVVAGTSSAWAVRAQSPEKTKVVQVSSTNVPTPADTRRATVKAATVAAEAGKSGDSASVGGEVLISRETYAYPAAGRRDPFASS